MKEKILYIKIIAIILIMMLGITNLLPIFSNIALAMTNGELENQNNLTNVENVEYDAKFKMGDNSVYSKESNINEENILVLNINVKDKGFIEDGQIKIIDSNFDIEKEKISSEYIKNIDEKNNIIELNKIIYSNNVQIEIPIKIKKSYTFPEDYFSKETIVQLTGKYKVDEEEMGLLSEKKVQLMWTQETDVSLTQNIEKYINMEDKILLQQSVKTEINANALPRENESLTINAIELDKIKPETVSVILNGKKLENNEVNYDINTGVININHATKGFWSENSNIYKIIYEYSNLNFGNKEVILNTTAKTKLYTQEEIVKHDEQKLNIQEMGNIVSISKEATNQLYKGYLYANSSNETIYRENNIIEISDYQKVNNIEIKTTNSYFVDENGKNYNANNITIFKTVSINKEMLLEYFGQNGYINIKNENGEIIDRVDNTTVGNEYGIVNVNIQGDKTNIIIETSKPIKQGEFIIQNTKAIKGKTEYKKSKLKEFDKFVTNGKITTNVGEEEKQAVIDLLDTKTEATLELNNTNLSTLQKNENVQFLITLNSNSQEYDLFKNPVIYIKIPKEINIDVKTISQLNGQEELKIENTGIKTLETGEKLLRIILKGEQTNFINDVDKGIQIAFMADLTTENIIPTHDSKIVMEYTNENRLNETFTYEQNIKLNSKYGMLITNKLTGFNNKNEEINNITNDTQIANLDINSKSKNAEKQINLINNYEAAVEDIYTIIKIPAISENSNLELDIKNVITNGKDTKIYYSEDINSNRESETWKENIEEVNNVRAVKIEIGTMLPKERLEITYNLEIPENLQYNKITYVTDIINYKYGKNANSENRNIIFKTEERNINQEPNDTNEDVENKENTNNQNNQNSEITNENLNNNTEEKEEISLGIKAISGEYTLKEGESIKEGQGITYELTLKNNTNKDITNVKINAVNENVIYYDLVTYQEEINHEMMNIIRFEENPNLTSKDLEIEKIEAGKTATVKYQISVKEVEGNDKKVSGKIKVSADGIKEMEFKSIEHNIEQSDLKLNIMNRYSEDIDTYVGDLIEFSLNVKNISNKNMENVILEMPVQNKMTFNPEELYIDSNENYEYIDYLNNIIRFKIKMLKPGESQQINLHFTANSFNLDETETTMLQYFSVNIENNRYISNNIEKTIYQKNTKIQAEQVSNIKGTTVKDKENIKFQFNIANNGSVDKTITITDIIQTGLIINEIYILQDGNKKVVNEYNGMIIEDINLKAGKKVEVIIDTTLDVSLLSLGRNSVSNVATITGDTINITTNKLEYKIERKEDSENPEEPENPNISLYTVSGQAWIDSNTNGQKDIEEGGVSGITVMLMDAQNGELVKDSSGNNVIQKTGSNGDYEFTKVKQGNYVVIFNYDTSKYSVTEYKKEGLSENINSDIISKTLTIEDQEMLVGVTETLNVNTDIMNIDAGLKENKKFDLKLDKYISKVEVKNKLGTKIASYDKGKIAKMEIDAKQLNNSIVAVEYQIDITNEGDVPGYANEIVDYIPVDLNFKENQNLGWKDTGEGRIINTELKNTVINSGETKTLKLILTKEMTQDSTGTSINIAEINKSSNDYAINDSDSIAGNKKDKEDDISSAELIISVRTGLPIMYISIVIIIIGIIGVGVYLIKKKVIKNK